MKKIFSLLATILLSGILASWAVAEPVVTTGTKATKKTTHNDTSKRKNEVPVEGKKRYSVDEQYKKRADKKKKALEMRQQLINEGQNAP